MFTVPAPIPVTAPVAAFTVAIAVLPDVQFPPPGVAESVVVAAAHTDNVPVIAAGALLTVTSLTA
jgi:hypothetical protein